MPSPPQQQRRSKNNKGPSPALLARLERRFPKNQKHTQHSNDNSNSNETTKQQPSTFSSSAEAAAAAAVSLAWRLHSLDFATASEEDFRFEQKVANQNMAAWKEIIALSSSLTSSSSTITASQDDDEDTPRDSSTITTVQRRLEELYRDRQRVKYVTRLHVAIQHEARRLATSYSDWRWDWQSDIPQDLKPHDWKIYLAFTEARDVIFFGNKSYTSHFDQDKEALLSVLQKINYLPNEIVIPMSILLEYDVLKLLVCRHPYYLVETRSSTIWAAVRNPAFVSRIDRDDHFEALVRAMIRRRSDMDYSCLLHRLFPSTRVRERAILLVVPLLMDPLTRGENAEWNNGHAFSLVIEPFQNDTGLCRRLAKLVVKHLAHHPKLPRPHPHHYRLSDRDILNTSKFPNTVGSDPNVILALCRCDGRLVLPLDPTSTPNYPSMLAAACTENPYVILKVPESHARKELLSCKTFVLQMLHQQRYTNFAERLIEFLPLQLAMDPEVAAIMFACCNIPFLPWASNNKSFWTHFIHQTKWKIHKYWNLMSESIRQDLGMARTIATNGCFTDDANLLLDLLHRFPVLLEDRDMIRNAVKNCYLNDGFNDWSGFWQRVQEETTVFGDKNFCLEMVASHHSFYSWLPDDLRGDSDILSAAATSRNSIPHIHLFDFLKWVPERRQVHVLLDYLDRNVEERWWGVPHWLIDDKELLIQAVAKNGNFLFCASKRLQDDFDVMLAAFANEPDLPIRCKTDNYLPYEIAGLDQVSLARFAIQVRERLRSYHAFMCLLHGMCEPEPSPSCHLPILNQGDETFQSYKKMIAKFVGARMNDDVNLLRRASLNMTRWGY